MEGVDTPQASLIINNYFYLSQYYEIYQIRTLNYKFFVNFFINRTRLKVNTD
ncbi:hypothetical protein PALI_a1084 [Pseudoalteromonas aliena SW19]|uniref:Uncharacterized protein n=1 Tax=Pseudoalteromonas aliena SW19 TaxID=1314866 RepID=A0ABR9DZP8_9GAMM|nr:hypothetical protein [Pseudoalteromonas aliena SW19]